MLLAPRTTPELVDHPLLAVRGCLFNIFAATLHICRPFLSPQPEDAPCRGDRETFITLTGTQLSRTHYSYSVKCRKKMKWKSDRLGVGDGKCEQKFDSWASGVKLFRVYRVYDRIIIITGLLKCNVCVCVCARACVHACERGNAYWTSLAYASLSEEILLMFGFLP